MPSGPDTHQRSDHCPVHSAHGLGIVTRVPARVKDHDPVGAHQVDPEAAGPRAHQEQLHPGRAVEAVDEPLPLHSAGAPVKPVVVFPRHPALL